MKLPDIDIDLKNRNEVLDILKHIPASINDNKKHNTGVYFNSIPVNPLIGSASIDYKEAEDRGYFKLDLLNVNMYADVKSEEHLNELMNKEPMWFMLEHKEFVEQLFHIHNHFDVVQQMKPQNVEQLAAVLAIIRPAKRYLLGKSWDEVFAEVWIKPTDDAYYFKKSHSTSYALVIVVQMNLLTDK